MSTTKLENRATAARDVERVCLKEDIWARFRFYELTGKHELDKTSAVCKPASQILWIYNEVEEH